jgi:hypothetical protein
MLEPVVSSTVTTITGTTRAETNEPGPVCRACRSRSGDIVLDLGLQPASDYFPRLDDPGPDPEYPLRMWLCARCGLAQLVEDPTVPEEPRGAEPAALVAQAADAVRLVGQAGLLPAGGTVAEYGSPHGGSWLDMLAAEGLKPVTGAALADVIIDCFGMMHAADQAAALAEHAARLEPGGTLLLQYHSLAAIVRHGQWNALRHGHYAYYSTTTLAIMLAAAGLRPRTAWQFELYGGTMLLAAGRAADASNTGPDETVQAILDNDAAAGVRDPERVRGLQRDVQTRVAGLRDWLSQQQRTGRYVLGYGAASRAVALLRQAGVDRTMLPAVADASPAKQGLRMPGTDIPVVSPAMLTRRPPDAVLLFVADLRAEVSASYPEVEATGGSWVDADALGS